MRADFKEFFDLRKLGEDEMGQIEFVLNSPAYNTSFKPYIQGIITSLNELWKDRSEDRKSRYPDEFLAGGVVFAEGLLKFFDLLIEETRMERIHKSMGSGSPEQMYDIKRHRGEMKPIVGFDQPATPQPTPVDEDY